MVWRILVGLVAALFLAWVGVTFYVQIERPAPLQTLARGAGPRALLLDHSNPIDPFLTRVIGSFADSLARSGWSVDSSAMYESLDLDMSPYDLIVVGTNTFNWAPDWPTKNFLKTTHALRGKPVAGIVTGFGSTGRAERLFRELLEQSGARMLDVRSYWEMRPNDKAQLDRPNTKVAYEMAAG